MIHVALIDNDGNVRQTMTCPFKRVEEIPPMEGLRAVQMPYRAEANDVYVPLDAPLRTRMKPPAPGPFHRFDRASARWVPDAEAAWGAVRRDRDGRLAATDWVVLRSADRGEPVPPEWLAYRQALRDITKQPDPMNIDWPTPPQD